ncbi:hypothetical protein Tco_1036438 [Tanacetum coccineum]
MELIEKRRKHFASLRAQEKRNRPPTKAQKRTQMCTYLKNMGNEESKFKSSFVEGCGSNTSKSVSEVEPKEVRKNNDAPIIKDWVSDDEEQDESKTKPEKKTVIPTAAKIEKPVKKSVRTYKNVTPRAVLLRTSLKPLSTAHPKPTVHCARPKTHFYKSISGKGTLKTDNLDFEDVYFVNELKFNLFSASQMCDKKNYVLFIDTECLVLSLNFKLPDENQILLKIPRKE